MTDTNQTTVNDPGNANAPTLTVVDELVGEGKKFKTVEELALGKKNSDAFIVQLQNENKTLRSLVEQYDNNTNQADLLRELIMTTQNNNANPNTTSNDNQQQSNQTPTALTHEDIVRLIEEQDLKRQQQANYNKAMESVVKAHGDKSNEWLDSKAKELGLSADELKALAQKSPAAFLGTVGLTQQANPQRPAASAGVNSSTISSSQADSGVRNNAYYEKLKNEIGVKKFVFDKNLQIQYHRDMQAQGDSFFA